MAARSEPSVHPPPAPSLHPAPAPPVHPAPEPSVHPAPADEFLTAFDAFAQAVRRARGATPAEPDALTLSQYGLLQGLAKFSWFGWYFIVQAAARLVIGVGLVWLGYGVTGAFVGTLAALIAGVLVSVVPLWWRRDTAALLRDRRTQNG